MRVLMTPVGERTQVADQTKDSIEIAAPPDEVMAVIADVASYPEWVSAMKQVDVVTSHPDGKPDHVKIKRDELGPKVERALGRNISIAATT